jgi:sugar/nucleoside kinase (ribokinase family)
MSVAIVGNLAVDRVAGGAPRAGGPVFYAAHAAVRLGADARIATRCAGSDADVALTPLEGTGLPLVWQPGRVTTSFAFHYEGERRVMSVDAVGDPWTPADIGGWAAPALEGTEWVHVGALLRSDFGVETLRALAAEGRRLLVDAQGLVRRPEVGPLRRDGAVPADVLETVQVLKLSEAEARLLAGGVDVAMLRSLGVPEVVLTLGSAGSLVVTATAAERVAAEPIAVADPTGAGDTYSLGYVTARADGAEPAEAARRASALVAAVLAERA